MAGLNWPKVTTLYGLVGRPLTVILTNGPVVSVRWDCAGTRHGHMGRTAIVTGRHGGSKSRSGIVMNRFPRQRSGLNSRSVVLGLSLHRTSTMSLSHVLP